MRRNVNRKVYNDRKKCKRDIGLSRCRALSVCILVLILLVSSSHQAHYKLWNLCFTLTPCLLDAYRLRPKRRISALCVTYSHLSEDKFLCQNVGLGSSTQHGRRSVGVKGTTSPHFSAWGDSIGNVTPLFQFIKTNLQAYSDADHSPLLKTLHRSSNKINIRVQI